MRIVIITLIYLLVPILIISLFRRYDFAKKVGTVILAYAVGVILALFGCLDFETVQDQQLMGTIQKWIMDITVPIAIPLLLFSSDFKLWTKSLPKTVAALLGGLFSIIIAVVTAFFLFRNSGIADLANVTGMMAGIYTGGTMNFYAIGSALHVDSNTITLALTFEMLITFPFLMFLAGGGYKVFRKLLPFPDKPISITADTKDIDENSFEDYSGIFKLKVFPKMMIALLFSILFLGIGAGLSLLIVGKLNELIIILTITTLAIGASFNEKIRNLPKTFELGMFFILIFSIVVASQFNINSINASALNIFWLILYILMASIVLHVIISRIFKVNGDLFTVAHVGLLCSPPFIPPIVSAMGNKKVLISGIVIGLIGYAVGTYIGVLLAAILQLF
jgi:uncharacterized membrane protein